MLCEERSIHSSLILSAIIRNTKMECATYVTGSRFRDADAPGTRTKGAKQRYQVSQQQRTAWRRDVGRDEKRTSPRNCVESTLSSSTAGRFDTTSRLRRSYRRSDVCCSVGVERGARSVEQQHSLNCSGVEQQDCTDSLESGQHLPQHWFASHSAPFISNATAAGSTLVNTSAASSGTAMKVLVVFRIMLIRLSIAYLNHLSKVEFRQACFCVVQPDDTPDLGDRPRGTGLRFAHTGGVRMV